MIYYTSFALHYLLVEDSTVTAIQYTSYRKFFCSFPFIIYLSIFLWRIYANLLIFFYFTLVTDSSWALCGSTNQNIGHCCYIYIPIITKTTSKIPCNVYLSVWPLGMTPDIFLRITTDTYIWVRTITMILLVPYVSQSDIHISRGWIHIKPLLTAASL